MTFYERYEMLCAERKMKPQNQELQDVAGITSGSISGWKKGASPKIEVLCRLAKYFDVTTDYLLGLSEVRTSAIVLTEQEQLLLEAFRSADTEGQFNIIHVCMDERKKADGRSAQNVG